ncbi:light-regulated signal transduction histidine kinase (bacteriophytochrome) [Brevundimonas bullata]|uniref:histidine kinase n=1 Tax=Brevundimonas bullata TaxID=13160 RepID=A0A7W7IPT2_9CAUL|nr:HWE histidine kinase domain-containing protein [Brevundimonas bullata]MBB4798308.1 light-regulated signal transduction histidine kinase (bacteriophytochrome) [Brevundimonas bullata]MBB6383378.1 light-regulated signal transduction histidine kinase (bacteriophytochrome) [Brevundimonas bullata]
MTTPAASVDLTNCDREPIHIPGAIQPIGFLVALTADWQVARVSANIEDFLHQSPEAVVGALIQDLFTPKAVHDLRNRVAMLGGRDAVERLFSCVLVDGGPAFDVAVHVSAGEVVIEAEPASGEHGDASGAVRSMMSRLDQAADFPAFYREGARQVRALLGYDRVMVYRFAEDGSGEVVAEAVRSGIGRFMGLRYPATDIPTQARELYRRNLLRLITDVNAVPVPIIPARNQDGRPLDLSLSTLRSVSPIHIEYLKNMGVGASLSISIIVDGKLWGLFACHHYAPRRPTFERRSVSELFAQMFSMRLESRERKETVEYERRARDISDQLLGAVASDETLLKDPDWLADILTHAIPADGVGVWLGGNHAFSGETPPLEDFRRIVRALNGTAAGRVFATDHIGALVPDASAFASGAAGLLAIPISRSPRDYVILFRRELVHSVRWGGDPHKPVSFGPNGPRLTPRESFAEWKELVEGRSQPFTASEIRVAETLRATLIEVVLRLADEASAERQQSSARQELLIAELNHRVRNILGLIRGLIRQSEPTSASIADFVKVVDGRIHALARAHNQITDDHWGPAPLQALIDAEAAAFVDERGRITLQGEPVLLNPNAYSTMALVLHELVTNSNKYGSLSTQDGRVVIGWSRNAAEDLVMEWREIGGPPVTPPTRQGFGTTIISRSVPYDLGGSADVAYEPGGVHAVFRIPARHLSEPRSTDGAKTIKYPRPAIGHPQLLPDAVLANHDILLVEDSLIIALDAEDIANRLGAASVTTAATVEGALEFIDAARPTVAMLDINLGDRHSYPIADRLAEVGVPFIFATGYGEQANPPIEHRGRPIVQKPYTLENVARAFDSLIGETS